NQVFTGALLLAAAGFASAWWQRAAGRALPAVVAYCWGLAWWSGAIAREVGEHVATGHRADALLVAAGATALAAAAVHRRRAATALALTVLGAVVLAAPLAFAQVAARGQPRAGWGALAWLLFAVFGVPGLAWLRDGGGRVAPWAQFAWWLLWPTVFSLAARELALAHGLGGGWRMALPMLPWMAVLALGRFRWAWLRWPQAGSFDGWRMPLAGLHSTVVGLFWLRALFDPGDSTPLAWVPLLNPLDLAQLGVLALAGSWLWSDRDDIGGARVALLAAAGFALATCITLRGVHHWGGIAWGRELWSASLAQMALTVAWSVLGVAGWITGSRRGQRALWLAGAVLMAVVLAKLVLVDRQHLGNLLGIGSFLAYGLLCTLVGWFAPAPPRTAAAGQGGHGAAAGA
ncbi:MAG: DUF2339 domain-containing protein, partial [Gammaproteobacteria bacterium]|nr:DUF2339 domain-containing protein [Gammaproteobacteria bacterium]